MNVKKIFITCLLLGVILIIHPSNASASSTVDESGTGVGIHILKGDYPPEPNPPSPSVYVDKIIPKGRLPQTGIMDSYRWSIIGGLLFILIVCVKMFFRLREKKRGLFSEKI